MSSECPICNGRGIVIHADPDGREYARTCECRVERVIQRRLGAARIPKKYSDCTLENFWPSDNRTLQNAKAAASIFVTKFPHDTDGQGLLLSGGRGLGKTHLAVALLIALIKTGRAQGLFYEYNDLLRIIRESYNPQTSSTEAGILQPVFEADVLVLDDLGSVKPSDWVGETVAHVLNTRYNTKRTTIVTTNFPIEFAGSLESYEEEPRERSFSQKQGKLTLGDRIGDRMLSRLREVCRPLNVEGEDYRLKLAGHHPGLRPSEFR